MTNLNFVKRLAVLSCAAGLALSLVTLPAAPAAAAEDGAPVKMGSVTANEKSQAAQAFMDGAATLARPAPAGMGELTGLKPAEAAPAEFDPEANPRVYEISRQLRCLVCANETIAESNAQLAVDLRREVAAQVKAGKTDDQIIEFMVDRYGDYVLFKPPFKAKTWLLWLGPAVFLLLALWAMARVVRTRRAAAEARRRTAGPEAVERAKKVLRGELVFERGAFVPNPKRTTKA